jgi:hypothetical protein
MSEPQIPIPPFPTDSGGTPAQDFTSTAVYTAKKDLDDMLAWMKTNAEDAGNTMGAWWDHSQIQEKSLAMFVKVFGWLLKGLADIELTIEKDWLATEAKVYQQVIPDLIALQQQIEDVNLGVLVQALGAAAGDNVSFGSGGMSSQAQTLFNSVIQPFTLLNSGTDPSQVGSGLKNQQFLLSQCLNLALTEQVIDNAADHMGMGFLKTIQPFLWLIDRTVHPSNVIRQAMDSSYALLLKAPVTRDLNRKFPIKDLGVTALAHLFIRGGIPIAEYLDRCLDSGLNNVHAEQLLLESSKQLPPADIAKLLQHGFITQADAQQLLLQQGFLQSAVDARIYLDTHDRYWSIQERVGNAAVSKWVAGKIDQPTMEGILRQTGFTQDEINILELEQAWLKVHPEFKPLTYSDTKRLFEANIIGIDEVVTFLEAQNYSPADVTNLVLLDFTVAAERQARSALLIARYRVQAQNALVQAAAETKKNETALADAKKALASELNAAAATLGQLEAVPGILALTGSIP